MSALREAARALTEGGNVVVFVTGGAFEVATLPRLRSPEDVIIALPEHLWEAVSVRRVAPGRFVVEAIEGSQRGSE